jgi:hypothetical protein
MRQANHVTEDCITLREQGVACVPLCFSDE